jgi:hypothetical protein
MTAATADGTASAASAAATAQKRPDGKLLKSSVSSMTRIMKERETVAASIGDPKARDCLKHVVKPNSFSKTMRSTGVALILAPEPITAVPGAVMLGLSLATKKRDPIGIASVMDETRRLLDEMRGSS